jgi:hypothetical protein
MENEYELLQKKLHNAKRTKLRLKNNLNDRIEELEHKLKEQEEQNKLLLEENNNYKNKLEEVKWATEWDNIEHAN